MEQNIRQSVIIIGAGLSGLSAADYILHKNSNVDVIVLEALDRVGGKTYTKEIMDNKFDMGAQFIGRRQKHVINLANRAKQQFIPEVYRGDKVLFMNGQRSTYKSKIPQNVNIFALLQMKLVVWKINRMAKKVPLKDPNSCEMASYWDSITVQSWMEKELWFQKVRLMFTTVLRVVLGCQPSEISMLFFLWFIHQNETFDNIINIEDGLQQRKLINGTQSLSLFLRDQVESLHGKIYLNHWVREVNQVGNKIQVVTSKGEKFLCQHLILATAPSIYRKIHFNPSLCSEKRHMMEKSFMGKLTKVILLYDRQYWKEKGYSGQIVSDSFDDPILSCFDDTKFDQEGNVKQPALIVFCGAEVYRYWKKNQNLGKRIAQKLAEAFQSQEMTKPSAVQWFEFDEVTTIGGAPLGAMGPGCLSYMQNLRKPDGNIHFAGTEMATVSIGYMDGAIQSGIRAANQILEKINKQQEKFLPQVQGPNTTVSPWYNNLIHSTRRFFQWW